MQRILKYLAILAVILFALRNFADNKADVDLWGNIGFVNAFPWEDGFLRTNTYSFTEPDHPWFNHEWLGEYILNRAWQIAGNPGLLALKILMGFLLTGLLYAHLRKTNTSPCVSFFWLLIVLSTIGYGFSTRPHHFTYLMLAAFLWHLKHAAGQTRRLCLLLPLLLVLWVNLHGAFFIGILAVVLFAVTDRLVRRATPGLPPDTARPWIALVPLLFLASFVNPFGPAIWKFIAFSASLPRPFLSEWAPFDPRLHFLEHPDFVVLSIIAWTALILTPKPRDTRWTVLFVAGWLAALWMRRNIPLLAIVSVFVIPEHLDALAGPALKRLVNRITPTVRIAAMTLFCGASLWATLTFHKINPAEIEIPPDRFPCDVFDFMQHNNIQGNLLTFFDWAEYAIWHLYPDTLVFLDGRFCSAYSTRPMQDYLDFIYMAEGWQRALEDYPTDLLLLHHGNPAFTAMQRNTDWTLIYSGQIAGLFIRNDRHRALRERHAAGQLIATPFHGTRYFP